MTPMETFPRRTLCDDDRSSFLKRCTCSVSPTPSSLRSSENEVDCSNLANCPAVSQTVEDQHLKAGRGRAAHTRYKSCCLCRADPSSSTDIIQSVCTTQKTEKLLFMLLQPFRPTLAGYPKYPLLAVPESWSFSARRLSRCLSRPRHVGVVKKPRCCVEQLCR